MADNRTKPQVFAEILALHFDTNCHKKSGGGNALETWKLDIKSLPQWRQSLRDLERASSSCGGADLPSHLMNADKELML